MNRFIGNYKGMPKEMYILCFATLINRIGDFIVPFLSLYLTQKIGLSTAVSGIIVTLSSIISIPASMMGGRVSDMYGRKKIYIFAQSLAAAALIPCAFTRDAAVTVVCLLVSTFFNGFVRPAFESIIIDILPNTQRQAGFSLKYISINVGVSIGPILAGFLFNNLLPVLFLGDALTSFIAVFLVFKYVKETHPDIRCVHIENKAETAEKDGLMKMLQKRPQLLVFLLLCIVYNFIYTQQRFSLPILMNFQFGNEGAKLYGYLMSINAVTVVLLTVFISTLTRKNHELTNMVLSGILYSVGFGMLGYVNNFSLYIASTIIWTGGEILSSISSGIYVANNSPSNYRARLTAIRLIALAAGSSLSTAVSGAYIQLYGCKAIWTLVLLISLFGVILMFSLRVFSRKTEKRQSMGA